MVDLRREGISPAQLSRCFSLNRSTSHRWEKSPPNQTLMSLQETLLSVFEASGETYGSRRLSQAVTDLGIKIGRFKARRLMRGLEIKAKYSKAKVWRKQAVDFAENSANGQCAMMPDTIWIAAYAFKPCDLPSTAASPLRTLFSTQTTAPNTAAKPFGMC
ncbi:IS3 family transposase [Mannheimia pernigra]|uniref:IS3 family transposase n=1 Tax=Mannheimia pernigra TaxID=111844 RepID=UPI0013187302|nr:IS3 family transposase [Mannheimia pernigra]QHB17267.1 IS3 family transposase [Mannheimia pernigra]QHB17310.1 IS3 family transposase [Mannheimia pernigra]